MNEPTATLPVVTTAELMEQVRARIRRKYAGQALDDEVAAVEMQLRRARDLVDDQQPLLFEELGDDDETRLEANLRLSSHRPIVGRLLVLAKRRLLLPPLRWLFEYSQENFKRQQQFNRLMYACLQVTVAQNVRLRRDLERLTANPAVPGADAGDDAGADADADTDAGAGADADAGAGADPGAGPERTGLS